MGNEHDHYLKKELDNLVKTDYSIFEFIHQYLVDGIWYWNLENELDEWMSPKFWVTLGYDPSEKQHLASEWQNLMLEEDLELAKNTLSKHLENPEVPYDLIVRYFHKNGSVVWIRCRGIAIRDRNGTPIRMLGAHSDITRVKKMELDLQRANEELQQFSFIASHDLKEPLRAIAGYSELLNMCCQGKYESSAGVKQYSKTIIERVLRLSNLIDDLLTYSRSNRDDTMVVERVNLDALLMTITKDLAEKIKQSNSSVAVKKFNFNITGDRISLESLFKNLVSNAVKFGGKNIVLRHEDCGEFYKFFIEDDGIGVDEESINKLFRPFYRIHTKDQYEGSGLGLFMCKKIVARMGGQIGVKSVKNNGTTFWFTLPKSLCVTCC